VVGSCKRGDEPLGSIKCREFLDHLRTDLLPKKDSTTWSKILAPQLLLLQKDTGLRAHDLVHSPDL
jgi:hypothetical protein